MPARPAETLKELRDDLGTMENASDRQGRSGLDHLVAEAARFAGLQMRQMELGKIRLARTEIDADQNGNKYKTFRELVRRAWCERLRLEIAMREGDRHTPQYPEIANGTPDEKRRASSSSQTTLGRLIDVFKGEPRYAKSKKTLKCKYDFLFRLLLEVMGEGKHVSEIERADCRAVVELLKRLPANAKKKFPSKSLRDIADHVAALPTGTKPPLLNGKTLNSHVYRMSTFFRCKRPASAALHEMIGHG